jgi:CRISPR-associated endoribonuclease Cas6/Csy4 subtype I-F
MRPDYFLDIEARLTGSVGEKGAAALPVVTRLLQALHKLFDSYPGRFAVAFPRMRTGDTRHPGNLVRVFAETRADLDIIAAGLAGNHRILGYVRFGAPREVPQDFAGEWIEYRRYRIPNRGSRLEKCRDYRLTDSQRLPYLRLASASNGHAFSLHIEPRQGERTMSCEPNGYGLSSAGRPFAVPAM